MQHPDEGTIHAWLDDALPPDEAARVAAHAAACEQCAAAVAEARGLMAGASRIVSSLDGVRGGVIPKGAPVLAAKRPRSLWRTLHMTPARAGLVAAVLIGIVLVEGREDRGQRTENRSVGGAMERTSGGADEPPSSGMAERTSSGAAERKNGGVEAAKPARRAASVSGRAGMGDQARTRGKTVEMPVTASAQVPVAPSTEMGTKADQSVNRAAPALERSSAPALQRSSAPALLRSAVQPLDRSAGFVGCYDVQQPPATSLRPLPDRFALERMASPSGAVENVVRPIEADGRRADALPGGEWKQVSQAAANVTWVTDGRPRSLVLRVGANGVMGRADSVVVVKTGCR